MATTTNPFAPPRTTDLEGTAPSGPLVVSDEALRELIAATPWVTWLARLTSLSIALSLVKGTLDVVRGGHSAKIARLFGLAVTTAISTAILVVVRRYAAASRRLAADPRGGASQVIAAQLAYFRRVGRFASVGVGLAAILAFLVLIGFVTRALR